MPRGDYAPIHALVVSNDIAMMAGFRYQAT